MTLYKIVRYHRDESAPGHGKTIAEGLTLTEAQAHCRRSDTRGDDWFDGYAKMPPDHEKET